MMNTIEFKSENRINIITSTIQSEVLKGNFASSVQATYGYSHYFTKDRHNTSIKKDSTSTEDMHRVFEHYLHIFSKNEPNFIHTLTHSIFEDGMENEASNLLKSYFALSPYPAISWFSTVFNSHLNDPNVSYRLLRCLCNKQYSTYSKNLISFVRGALNDKSIEVQESAFMVLESWRNKECLDVLENTNYVNPILAEYAESLKNELRDELC